MSNRISASWRWDGAGASDGPPKAEPGAGSATELRFPCNVVAIHVAAKGPFRRRRLIRQQGVGGRLGRQCRWLTGGQASDQGAGQRYRQGDVADPVQAVFGGPVAAQAGQSGRVGDA